MTGLWVLGFLLCCGACYIGARLFYAAMDDAAWKREREEEYSNVYDRARESYREEMREQNARAMESDGLLRAIAEYAANELEARR